MSSASLFSICVLIWGTTWYAITAQLPVLAPEYAVGIRFTLAALLLLAFCRWRAIPLRVGAPAQRLIALQGITNFCLSYICVYHAERFVVSGVVAVGYAASPLFGMAAARLFLGTPMSRRVAAGGVLGILGVALIFAHEFGRMTASMAVLWGALATAGGVLGSTVSTIAVARYQRLGVSGWAPLAWSMLYGGLGALALAAALQRPWGWSWQPAFLGSLLYLTVAGSVVTFGAYYALVKRVGPAKAGTIGVATPVVALLVSSVFEGFPWTLAAVAGVALALAGNALTFWRGPLPRLPGIRPRG